MQSMQARFQDVLNLRSPKSLFKWKRQQTPMDKVEISFKAIKDRAWAA